MNEKTIVYLTFNKVNNKFYIGVHNVPNFGEDFYLGGGCYANSPSSYKRKRTPFACAIAKHGVKNFRRITLREFDNRQDALDLERWLVTEEFIKRTDTYNVTIGGGDPPLFIRKVCQYSLTGEFIKEWDSIISVTRFYGISKDRIGMALNEKRSCMNSFWNYELFEKLDISDYVFSKRGFICQYSSDGVLLGEFKSIQEASIQLDINEDTITNSLFRRSKPAGFYFLRSHESIDELLSGNLAEPGLVYGYNIDGSFFKKYTNLKNVIKDFSGTLSGIKSAISSGKLYKDKFWSEDHYDNFVTKQNPRPIGQYDMDDNFIQKWDSVKKCKKEFTNVVKVLSGERIHTKNFKFKYLE